MLIFLTVGAAYAADNTAVDSNDAESDSDSVDSLSYDESQYDNKYYLFRGDCWTINNNFESSASVTSETTSDLTVNGTFCSENDLVGLYWYSADPIIHSYISYGNRRNYSDVILEFDYEMEGCTDFSNGNVNIVIESNDGEIFYLTMARFVEGNHVTLDFNNLGLSDASSLKSVMFEIKPVNYAGYSTQYTVMENTDFYCKIYNIRVSNGEIANEQPALPAHQYRLCEDYDDIYNLNPFRLSKEMRKLGYVEWVDLYIGSSYFYEKSGTVGNVISGEFTHNRTEKMVLDKSVSLNNAFRSWLDCYSRELKNNGVENLIISISMENLQCPSQWRQIDLNDNYAMSDWIPETFIISPFNDEAILYMQNVSKACLDITVGNGLRPILQMGETWWWWDNEVPYFYDNATKEKYLEEFGVELYEYGDVFSSYNLF